MIADTIAGTIRLCVAVQTHHQTDKPASTDTAGAGHVEKRLSVVIRSDQMNALADDALRRANSNLAVYARRRFPERFKDTPEPVLVSIAKEVRRRAAEKGFDREDHVATFLDLTVMYGSHFPQSDWAAPILNKRGLNAEWQMLSLRDRVEKNGVKL